MEHPEVQTSYGQLRGVKETSVEGVDYFAFKGVPYAKPPVGELRFKDSIPPEPWTGTRDAFEFGSMCAQHDIITNELGGSDDCLYLNIYAKNIDQKVRRPVMVWIHGGGFAFGSGSNLFCGPDYLVEKDIVLVTFNYRLGALGFLDLQDEVASGNQGLKDQVMALKWVRENIANFGGDPDNVTVFGHSAGGASVHYLTLSHMTKGLLHKAISQSGTAICPWASSVGDPRTKVYALCQLLNIKTKNHKEIIQYLRDVNAMELIQAQSKLTLMERNLTVFSPGSDNTSSNPFLSLPLTEAIHEPVDVPYLVGHTDREGSFFYKLLEKLNAFIGKDSHLENDFHPHSSRILKEYNMTIADLENIYMLDTSTKKSILERHIDMHGDINFTYGAHRLVRNQMERRLAPTYMYNFTYDKGYGFTKTMFDFKLPGASHMDDLIYMFSMGILGKLGLKPLARGTVKHTVMKQITEMWTNFAKFGNPTPSITKLIPELWQPVADKSVFRYMNIGKTLEMKTGPNLEERFRNKK